MLNITTTYNFKGFNLVYVAYRCGGFFQRYKYNPLKTQTTPHKNKKKIYFLYEYRKKNQPYLQTKYPLDNQRQLLFFLKKIKS